MSMIICHRKHYPCSYRLLPSLLWRSTGHPKHAPLLSVPFFFFLIASLCPPRKESRVHNSGAVVNLSSITFTRHETLLSITSRWSKTVYAMFHHLFTVFFLEALLENGWPLTGLYGIVPSYPRLCLEQAPRPAPPEIGSTPLPSSSVVPAVFQQ